jgi:hypothetical protein
LNPKEIIMKRIYPIAILVALTGVACAHSPKPYTFTLEQPSPPLDAVVKTLAANGFKQVAVDAAKSTITTRWFDTGYRFREISDVDNGPKREYYTDIFLRYRISLLNENGHEKVTLETDVQRCSPTDSVITSQGVSGSCLPMTIVFPTQQKEVDDLGSKLKLALAGS